MVAFADLRDARLGQLRMAAEAWTALSRHAASLEQRTAAELTGPLRGSGWQGVAADAAFRRMDKLDDEFEVAAVQTRTVVALLRAAAEEFDGLQRRLRAALDAIATLGLRIDEHGRVSPGQPSAGPTDPTGRQRHARTVENAKIYHELINGIVDQATEADRRIAHALRDLRPTVAGQFAWEYNDANADARTAAAALGLTEHDIPRPGTDAARVNTWWDGLSADKRQLLLAAFPARLGALNGLPATDRDQANQLVLRAYIGDNVNHYRDVDNPRHDRALMLLDKLESAEAGPPHKRLYLLSLDPSGDGRAAVAIGDPDSARHTAVLVPGVGTELDDIGRLIGRADTVHDAALDLAPAGTDVAVVAWLGYDTPSMDADIVSALFGGKAEAGGRTLDGFVDGLNASHDASPSHVTVIGHSYGSTVLGEAASNGDGLAAGDIVAVGSPGMRVDHAGEFNVDPRHVWVAAAHDDDIVARPENTTRWLAGIPIVGHVIPPVVEAIHGPGPHTAEFGANVLPVDTTGHSGYWDTDSQSLRDQAAIVVGGYHLLPELEHGRAPR